MGRFLTWAKFSVVAAALISPVFVFFVAIAVEILIGVVLHDHVIIGRKRHTSLRELGEI